MNKGAEVSKPLTILIVVIAVVVIGGLGYYFIGRENPKPVTSTPSAASQGSTTPTGGNATGSKQQAGAQGGLTPTD